MMFKIKKKTFDYREAQELFAKFKQISTAYCTYDFLTKEYIVEVEVSIETEAQQYRATLQQMYYNSDSAEEQDALAYADSAIKTLIDMGVLK